MPPRESANEVLARIRALLEEHEPSISAEHRSCIERSREHHEEQRSATTIAPPPPDLTRPMTFIDAITLARQFLALHEMPEPTEHAWRALNAKVGLALAHELARLFADAYAYQDGAPIAGAGCT